MLNAFLYLSTARTSWAIKWLYESISDIKWRSLLATMFLFVLATTSAFYSQNQERPVTAALVYVLGVTTIGATQGLLLAFASALLASIVYNFAIAEPAFVFRVSSLDDLVPLLAFNVCALVSGFLAGRLRHQFQVASRRSTELRQLLEASKNFQRASALSDLSQAVIAYAREHQNFEIVLYVRQDDKLTAIVWHSSKVTEPALYNVVVDRLRMKAPRHRWGDWQIHLLYSAEEPIGALLLQTGPIASGSPSNSAIDAFSNMVALTLERCLLNERLATSRAIEKSEAFKTALLASVSHDMRTPLATISASVTGLLDYGDGLDKETKIKLLNAIKEQYERLNRYTAKMLSLSRLQSGVDAATLPVIDILDVIGAATYAIRGRLGNRILEKSLPSGSLSVRADPVLLEQILLNILENAVNYSPDATAIKVEVFVDNGSVRIVTTDEGIGIPPSEIDRIFDRFYRINGPISAVAGSGLGLAIAKGFVEAIGGSIHAVSPSISGRGTSIYMQIPLAAESK